MRVILIGLSRDIEYDLSTDLFRHLVRLAPDFFARQRTGDIMARATNDLNAVRMMLGPGVMYWIETSLTFILAVSIMALLNLGLTALAGMPAVVIILDMIYFGAVILERIDGIIAK